jgi:glycosyltransferase involved in cell wall biosynthesis
VAKNTALKQANGEFIMFHDHDDVMNDGALAAMIKELETEPDLYFVMAQVKDFYSPELSDNEKNKILINDTPYYGLFTGAILIRKKLFDIVGHFDKNLNTGEIIDYMGKVTNLELQYKKNDLVASNRRIHSRNYGRTNIAKERKDYLAALRRRIGEIRSR